MLPGWTTINASYTILVRDLTNATLGSPGYDNLWILRVGYVIVTPASSVLFPAFSSAPLINYLDSPIYSNQGCSLWAIPPPPSQGGGP